MGANVKNIGLNFLGNAFLQSETGENFWLRVAT